MVPASGFAAAALVTLALAACADRDDTPATVDAAAERLGVVAPVATPPLTQAALDRHLAAVALDDDGRPRLVRATAPLPPRPGAPRDVAAIEFVASATPIWGVRTPADLGVDAVHRLRGGASLVALRQEVDGDPAREQLADAVHAMVDRANARVRTVLRPVIEVTLEEVGLPRDEPLPGAGLPRITLESSFGRATHGRGPSRGSTTSSRL